VSRAQSLEATRLTVSNLLSLAPIVIIIRIGLLFQRVFSAADEVVLLWLGRPVDLLGATTLRQAVALVGASHTWVLRSVLRGSRWRNYHVPLLRLLLLVSRRAHSDSRGAIELGRRVLVRIMS